MIRLEFSRTGSGAKLQRISWDDGSASGLPFSDGHYLLLTKSGARVPILDGAAPIKNARGEVRGVVIAIRDMTERKRIEDELLLSNEELRQFAYTASHDL